MEVQPNQINPNEIEQFPNEFGLVAVVNLKDHYQLYLPLRAIICTIFKQAMVFKQIQSHEMRQHKKSIQIDDAQVDLQVKDNTIQNVYDLIENEEMQVPIPCLRIIPGWKCMCSYKCSTESTKKLHSKSCAISQFQRVNMQQLFSSDQRKFITILAVPNQVEPIESSFKQCFEMLVSNDHVEIQDPRGRDSFQILTNFSEFGENLDWNACRSLVQLPTNYESVIFKEQCWLFLKRNSDKYANDPIIIHLRRIVMSLADNKTAHATSIFHSLQESRSYDNYAATLASFIYFHLNANVEDLPISIAEQVQELRAALNSTVTDSIQTFIHSLLVSIVKQDFPTQIERKVFTTYRFLVFNSFNLCGKFLLDNG